MQRGCRNPATCRSRRSWHRPVSRTWSGSRTRACPARRSLDRAARGAGGSCGRPACRRAQRRSHPPVHRKQADRHACRGGRGRARLGASGRRPLPPEATRLFTAAPSPMTPEGATRFLPKRRPAERRKTPPALVPQEPTEASTYQDRLAATRASRVEERTCSLSYGDVPLTYPSGESSITHKSSIRDLYPELDVGEARQPALTSRITPRHARTLGVAATWPPRMSASPTRPWRRSGRTLRPGPVAQAWVGSRRPPLEQIPISLRGTAAAKSCRTQRA